MSFVNVAIPVPLHRTFTYKLPDGYSRLARPGTRVVAPFRRQLKIGFITETNVTPPKGAKIKELKDFPDEEPQVSEKLIRLIKWISDYYAAPIGEVFAAAIPNLLGNVNEIEKKRRPANFSYDIEGFGKEADFKLNPAQQKVLSGIVEIIDQQKFAVALLHGVTGSGKTEVYLRLIEKVIASGKETILLVPEISLTPQLVGRVVSHFGEEVAVYHSGLTAVNQLNQWQRIKDGGVKIVVGTRSAIYAPFKNLGAIIVDEEHDNSYKQEESPRYHARDTAIMRAKLEQAVVVLGSATPSIESLANAKGDKYHYFHLPERHGLATMPEIKVVDMRKEIKSNLLNPYLSVELMSEIGKTFKNGHQTLLFLNRRGYANFFLCQDCGSIPECPNCQITLTYHKGARALRCHYCDYKIVAPNICPDCKSVEFGPVGSGTEMIEEVIKEKIPSARIARLDRDTATTETKRREVLKKMHKGELDILIGTQMITKGHDFPSVTLVGIISADQSIHFPDFRSSERTFQLLTQVSGRAGRALHPGKVLIQTYSPEHISIQTASEQKMEDFISSELELRKALHYPPYYRLANVKIVGNKETSVETASKQIFNMLCGDTELKLLGPSPAPLALLRGKVRWQILIKSSSARQLASSLSKLKWQIDNRPFRGVQVLIDVDPVSTM
jgi:primosomal protein N' (replication factor Y)